MTARALTHLDHYTGTYAPYIREHRLAGSAPLHMLEAAQPAGDFSDPPVSDMVFITARTGGWWHRSDFGAGRFRHRASPDDLFVVPPDTATDILVDGAHVIRVFAVPAAVARPLLQEAKSCDPFDFGRLHEGAFRNGFIESLLARMWDEAARDEPVSQLFTDGAVVTLLSALLREGEQPRSVSRGGLAPWRLNRVTDYLHERLAEDVSLDDLAAVAGLSASHFCRAFQQATGLPPHRYQIRERVERAKNRLLETDWPVTEIAAAVGYDDPNQLARVFRKEVGVSPTEYRRERRS